MGIVTQILLVSLWYFTGFGVYVVVPLKLLGLLIAFGGRNRARELVRSDARIREQLSVLEYAYLIKHAQFFIYPAASHGTAHTQGVGSLMFAILCVVLGLDGRIIEAILAAPFCILGYYIGGSWNHPFQAAGRAHAALMHGQMSGELEEKHMYDRIILVLENLMTEPAG